MIEHPNRFLLERHCVGDLPAAECERMLGHLRECPSCRTRAAGFQEHAARELAALPPERFLRDLSTRRANGEKVTRHRRWKTVGAAAGALAAAAAMLVLAPRRLDSVALRGTGLQVHRNRGGVAKLLESGDRIRSGDALRIVVTLPRAERVDVWFIDRTGRVDRLLGEGALRMDAGEQALPGSAIVDAPCSDMWLVVGVGSAISDAESALKRIGTAAHEGEDWVPRGCLSRRLQCE
jgi:hypothetical protein